MTRPAQLAAPVVAPESDPDDTTCCGQPSTFDPNLRGLTCGGLELVGWFVCAVCGVARLKKGWSKPADQVFWTLAKGGRSINAGGMRIRVDGQGDVAALMQRLVKLPELEREVETLRAEVERIQGGGE
jgi:hypothetical protein